MTGIICPSSLPEKVGWRAMMGAALLAGTGFTMSLFAAGLAFGEDRLVDEAKLDVLPVYMRGGHILRRALLLRRDTKAQRREGEG